MVMQDSLKQRRVAVLGEELGEIFSAVEEDLYALRIEWRTYRAFFGTNPERIDLLNSISGNTFASIESALWNSCLLRICRLTDPPTSSRGKFINVSVQQVGAILAQHARHNELSKVIQKAIDDAEFARVIRHKELAHSDFDVRSGNFELERGSRLKVENSIDSIAQVIKWVGKRLMNTTIVTHPTAILEGDAVQVLTALFEGKRKIEEMQELEHERFREGRYDEARKVVNWPEWLVFRPQDVIDV